MRKVICAAIIRGKKILLVRKKETWILPGGKLEEKETDTQCLVRELNQELPKLTVTNFGFYRSFKGKTPHTGDVIEARVYFADAKGDIKPNAEINAARWAKDPNKYRLSDLTKKIIGALRFDGLLPKK